MDDSQRTRDTHHTSAVVQRQLVLAIVLALLAALMLAVTAHAYVAQRTHDLLADFDRGTFTFTGLLDIPEREIDSVQLMPIGLTGQMEPVSRRLPEPLVDHASIAVSDTIYVIGGTDQGGFPQPDVHLTSLSDAQGNLSAWQPQPGLPDARAGTGIAAHRNSETKSTLYVGGGFDGEYAPTDTVFRAQIDLSSGAMSGDWVTDSHRLPQPVDHAPMVEHDGYLYVLGGSGLDVSGYFTSYQQVYAAPINPDGSLGDDFLETSALPKPLFFGYAVVYEGDITDTLYYVGGMYFVPREPPVWAEAFASEEVYFADFLPNGALSDWKRSEGALPRPLYGHSGVLLNGVELIVTGGIANPKDPGETLTSTVKAALVDPDNSSFRLYNWCEHVPEPCNLGAWQTGGLMPEVRALHSMVAMGERIYVMGGQNADQDATDTIFLGSVEGEGALYAPAGEYLSEKIDLGQPATLRKLAWQASVEPLGQVTLTLQYRTSADGDHWSSWSPPMISGHGLNEIEQFATQDDVRYFQYEAGFTTVLTHASPRLDEVHLYYEVPDPDLSIIKDTSPVITVGLGTELQYTIHYSNTGGWVAEKAVITEALPAHTSYAGGPEWHQVGNSNVYTQLLGNVERGESGSRPFTVKVDDDVPPTVYSITNRAEIDYPPMVDAFGDVITDENQYDNWHEISNPLSFFAMTVTKEAWPPAGHPVTAGSLITYTLRYTNVGVVRASQVVLTDTFDERGTYTIVSPTIPPTATNYVWELGSLGPSHSGQQQIVVRVQDPLPNFDHVTNQASLYSPEGEVIHTPVVTHPLALSIMTVTKEAIPQAGQSVAPGSLITYTLRYTNVGASRASQVVLTDTFDELGNYTIVAPPIPPTATEYVWDLGSLGPGESGEQQVIVQVQSPLPNHWLLSNQASLYSPGGEIYHTAVITHPVLNLSGTLPAPMMDLVVTDVRWDPAQVASGTWPVFQATVVNTGTKETTDHFWVSLYVKPEGSSPPRWPSDHDRGYCLGTCEEPRYAYVGYVGGLAPGEMVSVRFEGLNQYPYPAPDFPDEGTYDIYVQVDVAFEGDNLYWGRQAEDREDNNVWKEMLTIEDSGPTGPPKVYMPIISRNSP